MIAVLESIGEKFVILELHSMHTLIVARHELPSAIHEGDVFLFQKGNWEPLPQLTKARHATINLLIDQLFINPS